MQTPSKGCKPPVTQIGDFGLFWSVDFLGKSLKLLPPDVIF